MGSERLCPTFINVVHGLPAGLTIMPRDLALEADVSLTRRALQFLLPFDSALNDLLASWVRAELLVL